MRTASPADVAALVQLINAAYAVERFFKRGDRIDAQGVQRLMSRGQFLIETGAAAELLGCVFVERRSDGRGYFGLLAVDPAQQGGGIGRRLVGAAEEHARTGGCRVMDLRTVNLRTELPPFYRRLGYVEGGTEPYTEPDATQPCHFIVMSKTL